MFTAAGPHTESIVPRQLVHREAASQVLLTGWQRESADAFSLRARLPRAHSFYADTDGRHDPLLLAETVRQAGLLVSHAEFDVPFGYQFMMHSLSVECDPDGLRPDADPTDLLLQLTCHDLRRRGARLAGMAYHVHLYRDGSPIGIGKASFDCLSPAAYARLRDRPHRPAHPLAPPLAPALVGRDRPGDVVLSPTADTHVWELRVDQSHPVLFDHAVDHVPGMLLVEAMRQAAWYNGRPGRLELRSFQSDFHRYAEFDRPCLVHCADGTGPGSVRVTVTQDGALIAEGQVSGRP
nr:ScbA/BarX family gamma-butyrolactone biosynthesis protein [Streptacidiphilus sp. P02-A3a]